MNPRLSSSDFLLLLFRVGILSSILLSSSFASVYGLDADPLSLSSGPSAETIAALPSKTEERLYEEIFNILDLIRKPTKQQESNEEIKKINNFIVDHPENSDGYFMRGEYLYGAGDERQYTKILEDLNSAIDFYPKEVYTHVFTTANIYNLKAHLYYEMGDLQHAMDSMETAINLDYRAGMAPISIRIPNEEDPGILEWKKTDLDLIVTKYPKDYRGYLFRAVHYHNSISRSENYKAALANLNKVISLNPECAIAHYLLGEIMADGPKLSNEQYMKEAALRYSNAIKANPKMKEAYLSRANIYELGQKVDLYIKDYGRVIELSPGNGEAYYSRGLGYSKIGDNYRAIDDFTRAIKAKLEPLYKYNVYFERAKAYARTEQISLAIKDFTEAIQLRLAGMLGLTNLPEFRLIYPEYNNLSDDALIVKLHDKYLPNIELAAFSKSYLHHEHTFADSSLFEIYENRGDTYLASGDFKRAIDDYRRSLRIAPTYMVNRWKHILDNSKTGVYLDINTVEKASNNTYNFWVKYTNLKKNDPSSSVQKTSVDCSLRKINTLSHTAYDKDGNVLLNSDDPSGWSTIIPDTLGETLFNGWCSN